MVVIRYGKIEAVCFIVQKNRSLLLVEKRSIKKERDPGIYAFPAGIIEEQDRIVSDDYRINALRREILEEFNCTIKKHTYLDTLSYETGGKKYRVFYYLCTLQKFPLNTLEGESIKWLVPENALQILGRRTDKEIIQKYFLSKG
jgi:8-oxo-dGTP pyrophosphatase MutT (NUDIX family)